MVISLIFLIFACVFCANGEIIEHIIFDIETTALDWESFSESQKEYLLRGAETEEEVEKKKFELSLSAPTAKIICIALQLMVESDGGWEMKKRAVLASPKKYEKLNDTKKEEIRLGATRGAGDVGDGREEVICYLSSEIKVLEDFWAILKKYPKAVLVSFNGRAFDSPFLMIRSSLLSVRPSRNLMAGTRYNYPLHIDLADELTFFNKTFYGATRRYNFDFYTRAYGIESPKSKEINGGNVGEFYHNDKIKEISEYCLRDVGATWELFLKWNKYLRFR